MTSGVKRVIFDLGILTMESTIIHVSAQYMNDYSELRRPDAGRDHTSEAIETKMSNSVNEYAPGILTGMMLTRITVIPYR